MRREPRRGARCAYRPCGRPLQPATAAMRKYAGAQIDMDPFCSAKCCRAWYGCEVREGPQYAREPKSKPKPPGAVKEARDRAVRARVAEARAINGRCLHCAKLLPEDGFKAVRRYCGRTCRQRYYGRALALTPTVRPGANG